MSEILGEKQTRLLQDKALRICHSERSEESRYMAQDKLCEAISKVFNFTEDCELISVNY